MNNDTPADAITQADRLAAADLIEAYWSGSNEGMMKLAKSYRAGHSHGAFVRAFAKHRAKSLAAQDGLVERIAEALLSAFLAGRGSITARERSAYKPEPDMSHFRAIALASIEVKS